MLLFYCCSLFCFGCGRCSGKRPSRSERDAGLQQTGQEGQLRVGGSPAATRGYFIAE
ncbi:unnamed protein product [Ectocarpus sp. 12 AP-2014]